MLEVLWGAAEGSGGAFGGLDLDWLKRRISELLRAGRVSAVLEVKGEGWFGRAGPRAEEVNEWCDGGAMWDGALSDEESGGAGKLLRAGSYWRLFAKSSKVTSGMKPKCSCASAGTSGWGLELKLKRDVASLTAGKARAWLCETAPASLVTLHTHWHISMAPGYTHGAAFALTFASRKGAGPAAPCGHAPTGGVRGS